MKYKILEILYKNSGSYVSGQMICNNLDISRTAVWKHVKNLIEEGYNITSTSGKGYLIEEGSDVLNSYEIKRKLKIDLPVIFYQKLESTNNEAKKLAPGIRDEISLVTCSVQEGGRGRMGRVFESFNNKGAWCSFILKPHIEPAKALLITIASAIAVSITLEDVYGIKPGIKWPNDIIINNKKVCGILSEMNCETNSINYIILGIGINVSQEQKDFTKETGRIAASMYGLTGLSVPRSEIIASLCYNIQEVYRWVLEGNTKEILGLWKKYSITDGKIITILKNNNMIIAKATGIDEQGMLNVELDDGRIEKYNSGEISIRGIMNRK